MDKLSPERIRFHKNKTNASFFQGFGWIKRLVYHFHNKKRQRIRATLFVIKLSHHFMLHAFQHLCVFSQHFRFF